MLSGFNTNVRHKGVLFHVQTEDSGRDHPHVITHLFHGGNILASQKRSYADLLEDGDELEPQVKRLMDEQHGAMVEQLKSGAHDRVIRERLGSGSSSATSATSASSANSVTSASSTAPAAAAAEAADRTEPPAPVAPSARPPVPERPAPKSKPAPARDDAPLAPARAVALDGAGGDRQRPLDEVVLDYLLESARQRTQR